jgi:excisionase family DNA binding protein
MNHWNKEKAKAKNVSPLGVGTVIAAKRLGVSRPTLSGIIKRNEIRHTRVGRRVLITESAIREFLGEK